MSHEQHFEGDDSPRTWRSPGSDIHVPPVPIYRAPSIRINIVIKAPITKKPDQPSPVKAEGWAPGGEDKRLPSEIPQWERDYLDYVRNRRFEIPASSDEDEDTVH